MRKDLQWQAQSYFQWISMLRRNGVCYSLGRECSAPRGQVSLLSPQQAMECKDIKPLAVGVTCNRPEILPRSRKWMVATWWIKFAVEMNHLKYSSLDICFWLNLFLISPSANIPIPILSSPLIFNFRRIHRKVHPLKISLKAAHTLELDWVVPVAAKYSPAVFSCS